MSIDGPARPTRRRWLIVLGAALAIGAVELVAGAHPLAAALTQLRTPRWGWLTAALIAEILSMGLYARMQRRLLRSAGTEVSLHRHVALAYAAHSLSVTLPGGPMFSTRYNFQQMRRYGANPAVASWCIALSGLLSGAALVLIGTTGAIMAGSSRSWWTLVAYVAAALAVAGGVRALARRPHWLIDPVRRLLALVNRVRRRPAGYGTARITDLLAQLSAVRIRPGDLAAAGIYAIANWLLDAVCLWLCCRAVGIQHLTATELVTAYSAGMAAASMPLIPGNLGVVDGALVVGLVAGDLTAGSSIAAVVLYRLISLGFIVATGWVIWLLVRHRQRHGGPLDEAPAPAQPPPAAQPPPPVQPARLAPLPPVDPAPAAQAPAAVPAERTPEELPARAGACA